MLVTYLRSSSVSAFQACPARHFYTYTLGIPEVSGFAADQGNVVHKAMELLALQKLAQQEGRESFVEEELEKDFQTGEVTPEYALTLSWDHHVKTRPHHDWTSKVQEKCRAHINSILGGPYDPRNREVTHVEKFFDIELEQDWAQYEYKVGEEVLKGKLAIRGTVDLITRVRGGLEVIDWKTGKRLDWATWKVKEWADLREDFQPRLYHYALARVLGERNFLFTFFYTADGGPYTLPFGPEDLEKTEKMIRRHFETIKRAQPTPKITKRCSWCSHVGICEEIHQEVQELGMEKVMLKRGDLSKQKHYTGGGRSGG